MDKIDLYAIIWDTETSLIRSAMEWAKGCKKRAADNLTLNRTTLIEKLKKYDMMKDYPPPPCKPKIKTVKKTRAPKEIDIFEEVQIPENADAADKMKIEKLFKPVEEFDGYTI